MHDVCGNTCMHNVYGGLVCLMCVGTCMHEVYELYAQCV